MKRLSFALPLIAAVVASCHRDSAPSATPDAQTGIERTLAAPPPPPDVTLEPAADGKGLAVAAARPQGEALGRPTITFNKPVVALATLEESDGQDPARSFQLSPPAPGKWRWLGSASVELITERPLPFSTEFTVTVPAGLAALDGSKLAQAYSLRFSTPTLAIRAYDVQPSGSECAWSRADQVFKVIANQPIADPASAFFFELKGGERVPVKVLREVNLQDEQRQQEAKETDPARLRRFARASPDELLFKNQQTRYELQPARVLPLATTFIVALDATARGKAGPLPTRTPWKQGCSTHGAFRVEKVIKCEGEPEQHCASGPIQLSFTNPLGPAAELRKRLKLTPAALEWDDQGGAEGDEDLGASRTNFGTRLALPARLRAGQTYHLHVDAGVKDAFGQESPAFDGSVTLDDLLPSVYVGRDRVLLESAGDGTLPAQVTNLGELDADLWQLSPQQYAAYRFCESETCNKLPPLPPDAQLRMKLTYPKNEPHLHGIDLRAALKGAKTGIVAAKIWAPGTDFEGSPLRVLAQITDVAVHAKAGVTSGIAWVTSLQKGTPLAGAKVAVFDKGGTLTAEAVSDESGVAVLPPLAQLEGSGKKHDWEDPRVLVSATLAQVGGVADTGLVSTGWGDELLPDNISREFDALQQRPLGILFTDRGLYRPGEVVHVKGLLRRRAAAQESGLATPAAGSPVELELKDPEGKSLQTEKLALSRYGTFSADVTVPQEGRLGTYDLFAMLDDGVQPRGPWFGSFRVAEYRAPQFRVDLLSDPTQLGAGDELKATVSARYLFGGALQGAQATWSVSRSSAEFEPPKNEAFSFGRQTWGYDENAPSPDRGVFATGKGEVDKQGNLVIAAGKVEALADRPASYTVEAEVQDVSRQTVAGRSSVLVHPAAFYLGLGKRSLFTKAGEALKLPVVAVRPDGARVAGAAVHVTALSRSWHSVRKKGVGGVYQRVSEPVDEQVAACEVKTRVEPQDCLLTLPKPGFVTLRAEARDERGRRALSTAGLYALGPGFVAWQHSDTPRVELVPDKPEYAVGDVAHVLIKSPYPECNALITVEREGVSERRLVKLTGTSGAIDVLITERMVPDIYLGAVLQRARVEQGGTEEGDDPGRPSVRVGYAELKVGTQIKRLGVSIAVPKKDWRPRETVPIEVAVVDSLRQPRRAEVQLYAVDEGVLRLTGYQLPDPLAEMFPHRGLGVSMGEPLLQLVRRQKFGEKGEVQPGGGGGREGGGDLRSKFLTTALWATVETDAQGKAHVDLALPDNLTTFRLMAVALTDADRFGSGQSEVRVALPLLVLPALPRFARVGDAFEAGVVVHAHGLGQSESEVKVTAEVSGAAQLAPGQPPEQTVTVQEGVAREVRFKLLGASAGQATLRFRASTAGAQGAGGPFSDAVEQKIPVQLPVSLEAVAVYGDTSATRTEGLTAPKDVLPGVGGLTITLSSTALGGLGEGMNQLIDYPYGCLEQLSSRLVPFVALREVQRVFGADASANTQSAARAAEMNHLLSQLTGRDDGKQPLDADEVVSQTIAKISQLQMPGGGFRYWPGEGCTYAWPSIYATLALHRASQLGYPVKREVLAAAKRFLARKAEGQGACPVETVAPETRAFALQVLARMGEPKPAYYDELYAAKDKLPLFGKALLADAMAIGKGKRPRAMALLQDVLDHAQETPGEVHFEERDEGGSYAPLFSSDTRTTGMVLQTLVDLQPQHPFVGKIARYLNSVRRGGQWRNTQEAAYALVGLTEVVRVRERSAPDFTAKVSLGGTELFAQTFKGRSLDVITKRLPLEQVTAAAAGAKEASAPFTFALQGTGLLTYGALLRYAPAQLPAAAQDQGFFVQRWLEPYDAGGKAATEFAAGELVRVRLRVATRQERHYVAIEVPLPAGLEALDTQLATTAQLPSERNQEGNEEAGQEGFADEGSGVGQGFWSPFIFSEKRDDRVFYFADQLPPGVHVQSFVARATTPGKFLLKPARAEEMYTPEVFGRSEGGSITVAAQRPLAQK